METLQQMLVRNDIVFNCALGFVCCEKVKYYSAMKYDIIRALNNFSSLNPITVW